MKVIITAGGTGGHIYPALAIIKKIKQMEPNSEFLYIGTKDRMEATLIPNENIPYVGLEMKGLNRKQIWKNIQVLSCFTTAIKESKKIIKKFNPDVVLGIGGYVTVPVIYAAKKLGYKIFIHEQNCIPGLSNKLLAHYANRIGVSLEASMAYFPKKKTKFTGNPRGEEVMQAISIDKRTYGLNPKKKLVLIVMGSLGSMTINDKMKEILVHFKNKPYEVLLISGKSYYDSYQQEVKIPNNVVVVPYVDKMLSLLKKTDLIVSRAGASTIAEITSLGIPSILVPSPYVTHDHQRKNALALKEAGASIIIEEESFSANTLIKAIDDILTNEQRYVNMHKSAEKLGVVDSSDRIYRVIKEMIEEK